MNERALQNCVGSLPTAFPAPSLKTVARDPGGLLAVPKSIPMTALSILKDPGHFALNPTRNRPAYF